MILTNNNGKSWGLNNGAESANDLSYSNISNIAKATQNIREKEKQKILTYLEEGYEIKYYKNWIRIGGESFNGYTQEMIEKWLEDKNDLQK